MPKKIKFIFSSLFIRLMVEHPEFKKTYRECDEFEKLSVEEQEKRQFEMLKETLISAYENVPYYNRLFKSLDFHPEKMKTIDEIKRLPFLDKTTAINVGSDLYSKRKIDHYTTCTGGSSGKALTVLLDKSSIYKERAIVCHYMSKYGYDPLKTKTVNFFGHNKGADYYYSPLKNEIQISPFRVFKDDEFNGICEDIEKFGATWFMGYPSCIILLAQQVRKYNRCLNIKHVVYTSENCSESDKRLIEETFKCGVDSYYGHTERSVFAEIHDTECEFSKYYGYTELIPSDNPNEFRIACTGFLNKKMPLIRYLTDDVVEIDNKGKMHLVGHRKSEVCLIGKNGQKIFKGALTLHVEALRKIKCYQFVQDEMGKAKLNIVPEIPLSDKEKADIQRYLDVRCENIIDIEIIEVKEIQLTNRGKFKWAINNLQGRT